MIGVMVRFEYDGSFDRSRVIDVAGHARATFEGMPGLRKGRQGNLRVLVNVVIPRRLTAEQRELLEQLNDTLTEENLRSQEGMFAKLRRVLGSQSA